MQKKNPRRFLYLRKISQGILISLMLLALVTVGSFEQIPGYLLYETLPYYRMDSDVKFTFKYYDPEPQSDIEAGEIREDGDEDVEEAFKVNKIEETSMTETASGLVGLHDVRYQPEADSSNVENHFFEESITADDIEKLRDLSYLKTRFYTVDPRTDITAQDFDVDEFLSRDLTVTRQGDKPKVLIFHTHSAEMYKDSNPDDPYDGIMGVGKKLTQILNGRGIKTIHATDRFDITDGRSDRDGAYERMDPVIRKILMENPTIEVAIDLHRDGVKETTRLVSDVNGKPTAQVMFFNGLSKVYESGSLTPIKSLENKNLATNLAFSFQMQLAANSLYPGFTRKVYLNAYRYSLHLLPKSTLIEVGAQTNTKAEALNAMEPLAEILTKVLVH